MRRKRKVLFLPIKLSLIYLVITLILYEFGPFAWETYYPITFWILQFSYLLALWGGYTIGLKIKTRARIEWGAKDDTRIIRIIQPLIIIGFFFNFINIFRNFGFASFDFLGLVARIVYGVKDMGAGYNEFQDMVSVLRGSQVVGGYMISVLNMLWEFIAFPVLALSVLYFKRLSLNYKIVSALSYLLVLLSYISIGTNIGVFRIILLFIVLYYLKVLYVTFNTNYNYNKKNLKITILVIIGLVVFLSYFLSTMKGRGGILFWNTEYYNVGGIGLNYKNPLFSILPEGFIMLLISLSAYLTQGYYGFSLCLREQWESTLGIGNSKALMNLFPGFDGVYSKTYQYKIQKYGWDDDVQWHSMYSWFANDFSFIGVVIIMLIIGLLMAIVYKDCIKTENPFARILMCYLAILMFFIPCNNQISQSTYMLFSFITVFSIWFITRSYRIKNIY
jgi:hypothetical protein